MSASYRQIIVRVKHRKNFSNGKAMDSVKFGNEAQFMSLILRLSLLPEMGLDFLDFETL
jgi:hypothetical protein